MRIEIKNTVKDSPIAKQWHPQKNGKLKPIDFTCGSNKKVWWKCNVRDDHEWEASIFNRINGSGCPCCVGQKVVPSNCLTTTHPNLSKQWHPDKNGDLTANDITAGSSCKKVWWRCDVVDDHEWEAAVNSRAEGKGCPCCNGRKVVLSNCLSTTHPDLAKQWHPDKNDCTASCVTAGSHKRAWWKCDVSDDHEWEAIVSSRSKNNGNGCPCCSGRKVVLSNCLSTTHPDLAKQWHPDKNGDITADDIVAGSNRKFWWKCNVADDHEWESTSNNRSNGRSGCPCCGGQKAVPSNCLSATHPKLANQWHKNKNINISTTDITSGSAYKAWWKCDVADDHEWEALVRDRANGTGCPCCAGRKVVLSNCLSTIRPDLVKQWHPNKNDNSVPNEVTIGSHKMVWWKCDVDHEWKATVNGRSNNGCPFCSESKGEKRIGIYLESNNIEKEHQYRFKKSEIKNSKFDFSVARGEEQCLIEYHGQQHYSPVSFGSKKEHGDKINFRKAIRRDFVKKKWCIENNMTLLEIPFWDYDRIEEILDCFFAKKPILFTEPPEIVVKYEPIIKKELNRLKNYNPQN